MTTMTTPVKFNSLLRHFLGLGLGILLLTLPLTAGVEGKGNANVDANSRQVRAGVALVDAISGQMEIDLPLGPSLPGRIPAGIVWHHQSGQNTEGSTKNLATFAGYRWPAWENVQQDRWEQQPQGWVKVPNKDRAYATLNHRQLTFYPAAFDAVKVRQWLVDRHVAGAGSGTHTIDRVLVTEDGSTFLVASRWSAGLPETVRKCGYDPTGAWVCWIEPVAPPQNYQDCRIVVISGNEAIWTASAPNQTEPTTRVTEIRNRWNDWVKITQTGQPLTQVKLESSLNHWVQLDCAGSSWSLTNNLGLASWTLTGLAEFLPSGPTEIPVGTRHQLEQVSDGVRGTTLTLTWLNGRVITTQTAGGLKHEFDWSASTASPAPEGFGGSGDAAGLGGGDWKGYEPVRSAGTIYRIGSLQTAVAFIRATSTTPSEAGHRIAFLRTLPTPTGYDSVARTIAWSATAYRTEIRVYGDPDGAGPYRFTRLNHAQPLSVYGAPAWPTQGYPAQSDASQRQMLLFALSTVLMEEKGSAVSGVETVRERITYDGWNLRSMTNTNGTLAGMVGLTPVATRITVERPKGDGPTRVRELLDWNGRSYQGSRVTTLPPGGFSPSVNLLGGQYRGALPGDLGYAATVNGSVQRNSGSSRAWNDALPGERAGSASSSLDGSEYGTLREGGTADLGTKTFTYDGAGLLRQEVGTTGGITATLAIARGSGPEVTETTRSLNNGALLSGQVGEVFAWNGPFRSSARQKPDLRAASEYRDGIGQLTSSTSVDGIGTTFNYDGLGRPTGSTVASGDPNTHSTSISYATDGRSLTQTVSGAGTSTDARTRLDAFGRTLSVTALSGLPGERTVSTQWDGFGQRTSESLPARPGRSAPSSTFTYDADGFLTQSTNARGAITTYTRPAWSSLDGVQGFVSAVTTPRGTSTVLKDLLGQTRRVKDARGQITRMAYDKYGRMIRVERGSQVRSYTYNDVGWLMSQTQPEEGTTTFSGHTMEGVPTTVVKGGLTTQTTLNLSGPKAGLPSSITASGLGAPVTRALDYDTQLRLSSLTETQGSGTVTETYGYDGLGRATSKTLSDGTRSFTVSRQLDGLGRLTELNYPEGGGKAPRKAVPFFDTSLRPNRIDFDGQMALAAMAFDQTANGQEADILTYANGAMTTWQRDGNQDLSRVIHAAGATAVEDVTVAWSSDGLMMSRGQDAFGYDELGRLKSADIYGLNGDRIQQTFGYDLYGNRTSVASTALAGALPKEAASFSLSVGTDNRLPTSTAAGALTGVQYDSLGRLSQVWAIPGDSTSLTTWTYDAFGRVVAQGGADASWAEGYLLDGSGLRFKRTKPNGTIQYTVYGFNREPLSTFEVAPAATDVHGGAKSVRVHTGGTGASALAHALGAFNPGDTVTASVWFKAPSGVAGMLCLTDRKAPQAGDQKAYGRVMGNGAWQQISVTLPTTAVTSLWVNLFGDGDGVVYDDLSVSSSGRGAVFSDGFESGFSVVTDPANTTAWISCGQINDLIDSTAGAILAWKSDAVYGWGQLLFENRNGTKIYQQGDQLGSPSVLTNAAGAVIGRQKSLPFGERFTGTGEKSLRRYTNHEDGAQLPVYMQARMYLPTYGRFAEVDPVYDHSSDGLNLYSYVSNNPITSSDPDGMRVAGGERGGRTTQYEAPPDDVDFLDETKAWMDTVGVGTTETSINWYQNGALVGTTKAESTAAQTTMSLSDKGADALKQYEKIVVEDGKAVMYDNDGSKDGNATIGYGHMIHTGKINGSESETPYKKGISTEEATKLFKTDAQARVDSVNGMLKVGVSQQQFDALVSLAFNIGVGKAGGKGGLVNSDVMQKLNSGDPKGAAEAFKNHNKDAGTGKALQGLTNRRAKEINMFSNGVY